MITRITVYTHLLLPVILVLPTCVVPSTKAHANDDDGIIWQPIHEGGYQCTITPRGFELWPFDEGELSDEGFYLSSLPLIRPGCFVTTPWLPVAQSSDVYLIPGVDILWRGEMSPRNPEDAPIMNFLVDIRPIDQQKNTTWITITSSDLELKPLYFLENGNILYKGTLETSVDDMSPLIYSLDVDEPSEIRVRACTLMENTRLNLTDITIQTIPKE